MTGGSKHSPALRVSLGISRRTPALLAIISVLALIALGLWASFEGRSSTPVAGQADLVFYRKVIEDVRVGAPYYEAAAQEQRRFHFPLRPFVVVRPPLLAIAMAALPDDLTGQLALCGLAAATLGAWGRRLGGRRDGPLKMTAALLLLVSGVALALPPSAFLFHEVWAGLLIALSLALRRPSAWVLSLLIGLLAALTRELAAAYLVAMAALAWRDGCRREALAWVAALVAIAAALVVHAAAVDAQLLPGDPASQGWLKIGGWSFALATVHWNALLMAAPLWVTAVVTPLALLGLAAWRDPLGERVGLTVFGYLVAFIFVGRPENSYWGLLIAPLWPLGLLLAPEALAGLSRTLGRPATPHP